MRKITLEMPDNISAISITYVQSVSLGNINFGTKAVGNDDIADGEVIVIGTSESEDGDKE